MPPIPTGTTTLETFSAFAGKRVSINATFSGREVTSAAVTLQIYDVSTAAPLSLTTNRPVDGYTDVAVTWCGALAGDVELQVFFTSGEIGSTPVLATNIVEIV